MLAIFFTSQFVRPRIFKTKLVTNSIQKDFYFCHLHVDNGELKSLLLLLHCSSLSAFSPGKSLMKDTFMIAYLYKFRVCAPLAYGPKYLICKSVWCVYSLNVAVVYRFLDKCLSYCQSPIRNVS